NGGSNLTLSYDVENRLVNVTGTGINISYSYGPGNRRVWKTGTGGEEYYFYAPNGDRLGTYQLVSTTQLCGNQWFQPLRTNVYFAGKLVHSKNFTNATEEAVVLDRLASVVRGENVGGYLSGYYPYGEQKGASNVLPDKFATYLRDDYTGLDYAHNRYYSSTLGRFTTPDPFGASARLASPGSWNRYAYVTDDPVNHNDPSGLDPFDPPDGFDPF